MTALPRLLNLIPVVLIVIAMSLLYYLLSLIRMDMFAMRELKLIVLWLFW